MLSEKFAEYTQKNPRAALNIAAAMAVIWLAGIAIMLFNRADRKEAEITAKAEVKIERLEKQVAAANFSRDSAIQKNLKDRLSEKDSNYLIISTLNNQLNQKTAELQTKLDRLQYATENNKKLADTGARKAKQALTQLKENEN